MHVLERIEAESIDARLLPPPNHVVDAVFARGSDFIIEIGQVRRKPAFLLRASFPATSIAADAVSAVSIRVRPKPRRVLLVHRR
jgi:hypothetical protein